MKIGNIKKDNYSIEIKANDTDDFSQFSIINGLYPLNGGTHIQYIMDKIVPKIREKLIKKFKTIKPADIRNKMRIMVVARFVKDLEFTSQEKIAISNSVDTWNEVFANADWDKVVRTLLKDEDLMLSITEYFSLKEQAKENAELKKLKKTKKINSEKYYPPTKRTQTLILCEGASAGNALQPTLGGETFGYYELKGVPLNSWEKTVKDISSNVELSELYSIITSEDYSEIVIASDADADGSHIAGLIAGFIEKFLPEYKDKLYRFNTPIIGVMKGKKLVRWYYTIDDVEDFQSGERGKYFKGFGSWRPELLSKVIETDTLKLMQTKLILNDFDIIDKWLHSKKADIRKEFIKDYKLDLNKV